MEDDDKECPLCLEVLKDDDLEFFPCTCNYQVCRFCWHTIRTDGDGLCPQCWESYPENPANFTPLSQDKIATLKAKKKQQDQQRKLKTLENKKHLANLRVLQKNLVYAIGLPMSIADSKILNRKEYFGKYGKILNILIKKINSDAIAYITYSRDKDALEAILGVNKTRIDGKRIRTRMGITKYCNRFINNLPCSRQDCIYLHAFAEAEATFTREEIILGKHQEYEKKLFETLKPKTTEKSIRTPAIATGGKKLYSSKTYKNDYTTQLLSDTVPSLIFTKSKKAQHSLNKILTTDNSALSIDQEVISESTEKADLNLQFNEMKKKEKTTEESEPPSEATIGQAELKCSEANKQTKIVGYQAPQNESYKNITAKTCKSIFIPNFLFTDNESRYETSKGDLSFNHGRSNSHLVRRPLNFDSNGNMHSRLSHDNDLSPSSSVALRERLPCETTGCKGECNDTIFPRQKQINNELLTLTNSSKGLQPKFAFSSNSSNQIENFYHSELSQGIGRKPNYVTEAKLQDRQALQQSKDYLNEINGVQSDIEGLILKDKLCEPTETENFISKFLRDYNNLCYNEKSLESTDTEKSRNPLFKVNNGGSENSNHTFNYSDSHQPREYRGYSNSMSNTQKNLDNKEYSNDETYNHSACYKTKNHFRATSDDDLDFDPFGEAQKAFYSVENKINLQQNPNREYKKCRECRENLGPKCPFPSSSISNMNASDIGILPEQKGRIKSRSDFNVNNTTCADSMLHQQQISNSSLHQLLPHKQHCGKNIGMVSESKQSPFAYSSMENEMNLQQFSNQGYKTYREYGENLSQKLSLSSHSISNMNAFDISISPRLKGSVKSGPGINVNNTSSTNWDFMTHQQQIPNSLPQQQQYGDNMSMACKCAQLNSGVKQSSNISDRNSNIVYDKNKFGQRSVHANSNMSQHSANSMNYNYTTRPTNAQLGHFGPVRTPHHANMTSYTGSYNTIQPLTNTPMATPIQNQWQNAVQQPHDHQMPSASQNKPPTNGGRQKYWHY